MCLVRFLEPNCSGARRGYGNDQYPIESLFEAIARYEIKGLDLSHLYEGCDAGVSIPNRELIYGYLPDNKLLLVAAWISTHQEELLANWQTGRVTGEYFKVDPLR